MTRVLNRRSSAPHLQRPGDEASHNPSVNWWEELRSLVKILFLLAELSRAGRKFPEWDRWR